MRNGYFSYHRDTRSYSYDTGTTRRRSMWKKRQAMLLRETHDRLVSGRLEDQDVQTLSELVLTQIGSLGEKLPGRRRGRTKVKRVQAEQLVLRYARLLRHVERKRLGERKLPAGTPATLIDRAIERVVGKKPALKNGLHPEVLLPRFEKGRFWHPPKNGRTDSRG